MDAWWWEIIISTCLGLPTMILTIISIKKSIRRKKLIKILPKFSSVCLGRAKEKKYIIKQILSGKSIFVCGSAGIGKTTVIGHSILGGEKDLKKIYDKILYHRFSGNPSFEYACSDLAQQIDSSGSENLKRLLNEGKYLIWLDDCEQTDCLEELLNISYNPVFILSSRKKEQEKFLLSIDGSANTSLLIPKLSDYDAENLLFSNFDRMWFMTKKQRLINKEIIRLTNGIPLALSFIKNDKRYKKDPENFCKILKEKGYKEKIINPFLNERDELYSIDSLIKMAIGLDVDYRIDNISLKSQKVLGFLGCISYDDFPCVYIEGIFDKKVIQELKRANLIDVHDKTIKLRHPYIHQILRDKFDYLTNGDNNIIFNFLNLVHGLFQVGGKNSFELSRSLFLFRNHLLCVIKHILKYNLIANSEEETSFLVGLVLLSKFGFYEEVIEIVQSYKLQYEEIGSRDILHYVYIRASEGLEKLDECIASITKYESSVPEGEHDGMLVAFHNSLYVYLKAHQFDKAKNKLENFAIYIEKYRIDVNDERYKKNLWSIIAMAAEFKWYYCDINDMEEFINEQVNIIKNMEKIFDHDDYDIIDAKLILAFSLAKIGYNRDVISIFKGIFSSLNNRYSFNDPSAIEVVRKIEQFYYNGKNYNQANEILQHILPYAVMIWGNEHIITRRLREDNEKNNEKLKECGFDESQVLFKISLCHHDKRWINNVKRLFKIDFI